MIAESEGEFANHSIRRETAAIRPAPSGFCAADFPKAIFPDSGTRLA